MAGFMQLETVRAGALYSVDCQHCGCTQFWHEWIHEGQGSELHEMACTECGRRNAVFPGLGCTLDAVTDGGMCVTIAGVGTAHDWNVSQCREYAHQSGYTKESKQSIDGLTVFHWTKA